MSQNRAEVVDRNLRALLAGQQQPVERADRRAPVRAGASLTGHQLLDIIDSQFSARQLDLEARRLKDHGEGYYTISSAGHEGNAAVAAALRPTDPAFLHYRSGAFFAQRAKQVPGQTPIFDVLLSLCAAREEPIAAGRHKVFGSRALWIPPQTSTIASHLPKATGTAFAIDRGRFLGLDLPVPDDAIVVCSLGDASLNHSTALGAINAAMWAAHQHVPVPVLWVCEDNGVGISVHTPERWIESTWSNRPDMAYFSADGLDPVDTFEQAVAAAHACRRRRAPVFLHLKLVRLLGHAGTDPELAYHDIERIKAAEANDPLLRSCEAALASGVASAGELEGLYDEIGERVSAAAVQAARRPHHESAASIMEALAPYSPVSVTAVAERRGDALARVEHWRAEDRLPERREPEHLAKLINWGLHDLALEYPELLVFGEDVAKRGGVYGITAGLWQKLGGARVFNTLLDEQSILGMAIGAGHLGLLPVPEIQYLAYFHNACDQIRGEAASLQYFSDGQFRNPMVVRVASFGYQKGFGGHFHNDNSIAALRDIPGLVLAAPSRGEDAVGMLRTCVALAKVDGRVCMFLEPIALYMTRDLHADGDGLWRDRYPEPGVAVPLGTARVYSDGDDLTLVSWANGLWRTLRAARMLEQEHGIRARTIDLRWLLPLDTETLLREVVHTGRALIVDEGRRTGGVAESVITAIVEGAPDDRQPSLARVTGADTFIPLGPAWNHVLPSEEEIVARAVELVHGPPDPA